MGKFAWKGVGRGGERISGTEVAASKDAVISVLRRRRIVVTTVKEKGREIALPTLGGGVTKKDLAVFTREMSVMIDAGLPLVQCLEILGGQQTNRAFGQAIQRVRHDVESGLSLSDALARHPRVFDDLYCNMVAAGETAGVLDVVLDRLATYIEKIAKLASDVRAAMVYPVAVMTIAAIIVWLILWKVIPTFASLFHEIGGTLPLPTAVVVWASTMIGRYGLFVVGGIGLAGYVVRAYHGTERGRRVLDRLLLATPVLGIVLRKVAVARFCRTMSTLVTSGVPILDALEITARTAGNAIVEDAVRVARKSISEGRTFAEPLAATGVFPPMVSQMVGVGEHTGALDTMLGKIADFYEAEVDAAVEGLLALLEPIMIAFLGTVIGGIVISMYLPMIKILDVM